nr:wsv282 [Shrimp white spot syndrome virus]
MLSSSGMRLVEDSLGDTSKISSFITPQTDTSNSSSSSTFVNNCTDEDIKKRNIAMGRVAELLSNIAASSNEENNFRPVVSLMRGPTCGGSNASNKKLNSNRQTIPQVLNKVIFFREIHSVIALYLSSVCVQRAMNNDNTNSSGYAEGMVTKILNIIGKIPYNEMSREKFISVGRDALYLYQNVITDMTGPKHNKRLRIPQQQADFCYIIAMLVNDVPITSDLLLTGKATNLVQFASAMVDPAYRLAVHKMASVFNSSYSVYKVLDLDHKMLLRANLILSILSARNKCLSERKPRTLTQSVYLFLNHLLRNKLRSSGLTSEESSLGTAVKLVSQQLMYEGVTRQTIEDGCSMISGNFEDEDGVTLKCLGADVKDVKTVGLSALLSDRLRKNIRRNVPFY